MLGDISNCFFFSGDIMGRVDVFVILCSLIGKNDEFKVGFQHLAKRRQGCQRFILLPSDPKRILADSS